MIEISSAIFHDFHNFSMVLESGNEVYVIVSSLHRQIKKTGREFKNFITNKEMYDFISIKLCRIIQIIRKRLVSDWSRITKRPVFDQAK